jgi:hypothetical protein
MPITVEKSPLVEFDSKTSDALQTVIDTLELQSENVKSVSVLANFSIDKLASLQHNCTVVSGIVVHVSKDYKLSPKDKSWFHPDIATGRSVFQVNQVVVPSKFKSIELDGIQSSIGEYSISRPDEFGCETVQRNIVVDTSASALLNALYNKWINTGVTAGEVDKQWKRMKFQDKYGIVAAVEDIRTKMVQKIDSKARLVYSDTVCAVLSDSTSIYFTNNAVKRTSENVLIKSSALGGYRMYNSTNDTVIFYPASLGSANDYYSWDKMTPKNCQRIENSCAWDGELAFNAVVMRPPSISGQNIRKMEDAYELSFRDTLTMNTARFSPTDDVRDNISPEELLKLHPDSQHISNARNFIEAPVNMQHPVLNHLMNNIQHIQSQFPDFHLFNPQIMKNGRLKIPKEIYKQIA